MFKTTCSCLIRSSSWRIYGIGHAGLNSGKRIRHVDKPEVDVVGGKGEICGASLICCTPENS